MFSEQDQRLARHAWQTLEPYHAMIYFVPEAREHFKQVGLKGFWMGYFASRAAPLGTASAQLVTATFYNFQPAMVARAIPDAWSFATPEKITRARLEAADTALRRFLGESVEGEEMREAAELARVATEGCTVEGRPLFAGYRTLTWPSEPHLILWHAATLLREYRGDGHVAALLTHGLDGCEAHLTLVGTGNVPREMIQASRGWSDEEWQQAHNRLLKRGMLDEAGLLTTEGQALRQAVEDLTDTLALPPWQHLGQEKCERLIQLVRPFSLKIGEGGGVSMPNPMGLPAIQ